MGLGHRSDDPAGRSDMVIHARIRPKGSSGCIVFPDNGNFDEFSELMQANRKPEVPAGRQDNVPMNVNYWNEVIPNYEWANQSHTYDPPVPFGIPIEPYTP